MMVDQKKPTPLYHRWLVRILLAMIFMFGSEILLWTNPTGRTITEWLLLIVGYISLAAFLLDILRRYKVRDFLGLVVLAGVYGLLNGLIINPDSSLFELPRTLISRVTGAHSLLGLEMIFVFLALTGGHLRHLRRVMLIGAVLVGLAWGIWGRWSPEFADVTYGVISLETLLLTGGFGVSLLLAYTFFVYYRVRSIYPDDMLLSMPEWAILAPISAILLFIRIAQQTVDTTGLLVITILLFLSMSILWFRKNTEHKIILAYHLPIFPLDRITIMLTFTILIWTTVLAYHLPFIGNEDINQFTVVTIGFNLYGIGWLPTVSLLLGTRAYIRQVQSKPL